MSAKQLNFLEFTFQLLCLFLSILSWSEWKCYSKCYSALPVTEITGISCDLDSGAGGKDWIKHNKRLKKVEFGTIEQQTCFRNPAKRHRSAPQNSGAEKSALSPGNNGSALLEDGNSWYSVGREKWPGYSCKKPEFQAKSLCTMGG